MSEYEPTSIDDELPSGDPDATVTDAVDEEEPETWMQGSGERPIDANAPDWQEQQIDAVDDPFDEDGFDDGTDEE